MIGVLGLALISASVLLLLSVARLRNSPNPPRWTRWGVTLHSTLVAYLVGSLAGGSLIFMVAVRKSRPDVGILELVSALGVLAVTVVLWRLIDRIPRDQASADTGAPESAPDKTPPARRRAA